MKRVLIAAVSAGLLVVCVATNAWAHANLTRCSIHNHQAFTAARMPHSITAYFAEPLDPAASQTWMAVFEGDGDHGLVTENQHSVVNYRNPKEMTLRLPRLSKGPYYMIWHTSSAGDGHIASGILYFRVK